MSNMFVISNYYPSAMTNTMADRILRLNGLNSGIIMTDGERQFVHFSDEDTLMFELKGGVEWMWKSWRELMSPAPEQLPLWLL